VCGEQDPGEWNLRNKVLNIYAEWYEKYFLRPIYQYVNMNHSVGRADDSFNWNWYTPRIDQIEKLGFFVMSRYKFKLVFWCVMWIYTEESEFLDLDDSGGVTFSGNCHTLSRKLFHTHQGNRWYTCSHRIRTCDLQTEEIGHKIITTAKISSIFNGSPRNFQTSFHRTFQNFKQFFTEVKGSPCHSKEWTGKLFNLEMQTF